VESAQGGEIAREFFMSAEFINRGLSDEAFLNSAYLAFFDREIDIAGKQYWLNQLSGGVSRLDVVDGFTNSQEFRDLADYYGIRAY